MKLSSVQIGLETLLRGTHQFAMERRAHRQQHGAAGSGGFREFDRAIHGAGMPRDHHLVGRIQIGGAHHLALRGVAQHGVEFTLGELEDRGHGADARRDSLLHVAAALTDQLDCVGEIESAGRDQRGVFAQAVTGDVIGLDASFPQHSGRGGRDRQQRRLGILGQLEGVFGTPEAEFGQRKAERGVGFVKDLSRNSEIVSQALAHTGELRSLAGKNEGGFWCQIRIIDRLAITAVFAAILSTQVACGRTPEYGYRVVHVYPHDRTAFTQGLEYRGGFLYEGTGRNGQSSLRKVELETGKVLQESHLGQQYFGEGITVLGGHILELTWQSHQGFVYDQATFRLLRMFEYPGEGWGLTNDGRQIYMSDGSPQIRMWDASTLAETRRITVRDGEQPVRELNELEFVRGEIYANVWQTDRIARISPDDGRVLGWIDLTGLLPAGDRESPDAVLNGIAYDAAADRLFVTGKLWPKLFEIRLVPKAR